MPTEEEERWAQMAQRGGQAGTMPPPQAPEAPQAAPPPPMAAMEESGGKGRKGKKETAPKAAKQPRQRGGTSLNYEADWVLTLDEGPSKQELEQMAAAELFAALAPSYDLLHVHVPDAASPEDAMRKIESQLGPAPRDLDPDIPDHPIWQGDALVYSQLKRHYGKPHQGSSFARGWHPGAQS